MLVDLGFKKSQILEGNVYVTENQLNRNDVWCA